MGESGSLQNEPAGLSITPRKISHLLSTRTPRYWFDNHPFKTHFFNAQSSTFPVGERFFIKSVRYYEDQLKSEVLIKNVKNFIGQEGHHSVAHDHHIQMMRAQEYTGIERFERIDKWLLDLVSQKFPRFALAATISLEHFTAILANEMLSHPDRWLQPMHKDIRLLWHWHAVEETEHKAVAYDVYQEVCGSYLLRVTAMIIETFALLLDVSVRTIYFLWKDRKLFNPRIWLQGIVFVWGRHGVLSSVTGAYFQFFRRNFHPWQVNNHHLVDAFIAKHQYEIESN